jgi:hypothetical protein
VYPGDCLNNSDCPSANQACAIDTATGGTHCVTNFGCPP